MGSFQEIIVIGNVGRKPELRYTQSGIAVCDFSVAVSRRMGRRDDPERTEKTTWFRVTCWRQQAEIASQFVRKGAQIMVVGTIEASAYTDRSGQPAASLELDADRLVLLGERSEDDAPPDAGEIPF